MKPAKFSWGQRVRIHTMPTNWLPHTDYTGYAARISDHSRSTRHEYSLKIYKNGRIINSIAWIAEKYLEAR